MHEAVLPLPLALADVLHSAMVTALPEGPYPLPASLQPLLLVVLSGRITLFQDGEARIVPPVSLCGGMRGICRVAAEAGTRILTISAKPGRLAALFGLPAVVVMEEIVPLGDLLDGPGREGLARLVDLIDLGRPPADVVAALGLFLTGLRARVARPGSDLPMPTAWMGLPLADLADRFGLSPRQFERRFVTSYGQPLRSFRRQARCSRAITDFICGRSRVDNWASVAVDAGYFDQAHFSRDLVRFTGHSPGSLARGIAGGDPAFWPYRFSPQIMARLFGPTGF